jgi:hypothetical protein
MTPNLPPSRPVTVGAFASACSLIIVWLIRVFTPLDPPPEITGAIAIVVYFVTALFVPDDPEPTGTG